MGEELLTRRSLAHCPHPLRGHPENTRSSRCNKMRLVLPLLLLFVCVVSKRATSVVLSLIANAIMDPVHLARWLPRPFFVSSC
jgi:hypothetical protein